MLTTNLLGWRHAKPCTREDFNEARIAVDRLLACLAVEEAFAVLIANYVSFEKSVAGANIENMVERGASTADLNSRRREVDRHLVNLLAAGQMFTDHACGRTKKEFGRKSNVVDILNAAVQQQRTHLAGFWATECLRDAVLHNALPITSWTTGGQWVGLQSSDGTLSKLNPTARLEHSVSFTFSPDLLARDRKIDPALIVRLRARADKKGNVSWVPVIREYVEGLSIILAEVRKLWADLEGAASARLREMIDAYRSAIPDKVEQPMYILVVEKDDEGGWLRDIVLNLGLEVQLSEFRRQHRPMINLHRRSLVG